jgi:hypothetical protein
MIGSVIVPLLEAQQANGVKPHQPDERKSERDKREIEHDRLLSDSVLRRPTSGFDMVSSGQA